MFGIGRKVRKIRGSDSLETFVKKLREHGVDVSAATAMRYEKGQVQPIDYLMAVAELGGKSLEWITLGGGREAEGSMVLEPPEIYGKRARLVREVKDLARDAADDVIDALLKNVEVFKQVPKR